ncbi:hypothetical protein [Bradyrhizobium monzae]|uniref:hypothetical protein n=1 Tax=Bradyrhizobium sp. Oc8 TaxID=2876780 RepID=UPI001F311E5F|nr:hypothetical protein [Bradyrhizobium sp. Oc8]
MKPTGLPVDLGPNPNINGGDAKDMAAVSCHSPARFCLAVIAATSIHPANDAKKRTAEERSSKHHEIGRRSGFLFVLKMLKPKQPH